MKKCNAIFLDEFFDEETFMRNWLLDAEICWIAVNVKIEKQVELIREHIREGEFINLSLNLRNSKEILDAAKAVTVEELMWHEVSALANTPSNFPNGPRPEIVESIEEAIKRIRKETKKGILVIIAAEVLIPEIFYSTIKGKYKCYLPYEQGDKFEDKDPYQWLRDGEILVTQVTNIVPNITDGFEWPIVIYLNTRKESYISSGCSSYTRCTSKLYIVRKSMSENNLIKSIEASNDFTYIEIQKMFLSSLNKSDESKYLFRFIRDMRLTIDYQIRWTKSVDWLTRLRPILQESINEIEMSETETVFHSFVPLTEFFLIEILRVIYFNPKASVKEYKAFLKVRENGEVDEEKNRMQFDVLCNELRTVMKEQSRISSMRDFYTRDAQRYLEEAVGFWLVLERISNITETERATLWRWNFFRIFFQGIFTGAAR